MVVDMSRETDAIKATKRGGSRGGKAKSMVWQ